uniref:Uncharacterized protein n=1 Tax=Aegilops tauschii TaxID=37682 RepID=M8C7X7_AEGTA
MAAKQVRHRRMDRNAGARRYLGNREGLSRTAKGVAKMVYGSVTNLGIHLLALRWKKFRSSPSSPTNSGPASLIYRGWFLP